ncbi:MAG: hypothetical protein QNJ12_01415 [Ilumatobacter sp.]|uniref:hypothetical protein n=1 Tax=Ilumatobacter sp. TaxID=1967498 RepID=UPI00261ADE2A|nr:hypothetical protein [Ilumatobacter sp.]MDJ0767412.1 hypothetical protein [Ilumatobacter sp.]
MPTPAQRLADVVTMPARTAGSTALSVAEGTARHAFDWTANNVDDWGRDNRFVDRVWTISRLRWNVAIGGIEHVPKRAGALIVVNARRFALAPLFAALSIGAAVDRPVRFVGRPDVAPLGPMMQRLGGLLPIEDELEGALRAGQVIVLGADHEWTNRRAGLIDHHLVGAAVAARARLLPAATTSVPMRRNARVEIGPPIRPTQKRRGPLAELELADLLLERIDDVLDELGGTLTGTPLDWLPLGGIGGL